MKQQTGDTAVTPTLEVVKKPQSSNVKTVGELLKMKVTEVPMLLSPLLKQVGIAALSGSSDVGKSYLCLNLVIAICSQDKKVLDLDINRKHGKAIMICTEDDETEISCRLTKMLNGRTIPDDSLRFIFEPDLNAEIQLEAELKKCPADLVVLDTMGDLITGNLNQSVDVRHFFRPYKKLARKYKCAILFNHHIGKGKEMNGNPHKNDMLGSQGIESACRTVFMLSKKTDAKRVLTVVKGNSLPEEVKNKGIELDFSPETGFTPTGNTISHTAAASNITSYTEEQIKTIAEVYNETRSVMRTSELVKEQGIEINKNKVMALVKDHPSVQTPKKKKDGQTKKAA